MHCGDSLDVQVDGRWLPVRVEWPDGHGWVLYADDDRCASCHPPCSLSGPTPETGAGDALTQTRPRLVGVLMRLPKILAAVAC